MNLLVALGTSVAYFYSVLVLLFPELFPEDMRHLYFDSSSAIITFVLLGRYLETRSRRKATEFMKKLLSLKPQKTRIIVDGKEVEVPAENLVKGDIVLVKAGDKIPADGTVIEGEGEVNEATITGESIPVYKTKGDKVISGTILINGFLQFKAEKSGKESTLYQIIRLLLQAQSKKPPIGRLADKITAYFVPLILIVAIVVFDVWFVFADNLQYALLSSVSVLVIACPCALGLATPIAIVSAVGRGSKEGILIKNPEVLEVIKDINVVVFDKTGTLTKGKFKVVDTNIKDTETLRLIVSAEKLSNHPLSKAIVEHCKKHGIKPENPEEFKVLAGKGIYAQVNGKKVLIGNEKLLQRLEKNNIPEQEGTVLYVNIDGEYKGYFILENEVKEEAKKVVEFFKNRGIKTVLLTGDNEKTARKVSSDLGIEEFVYGMLPEDKYRYIEKLQKDGNKVMFVGDGVNDAPAMGKSDVGIAVGTGTDIAKEAGDIILLNDNLYNVVKAYRISEEGLKVIKQNLFWAYIYNVIGIPVAAGILYPVGGILLKPVFAGIAMSMSSVSVVMNALRLQFKKI